MVRQSNIELQARAGQTSEQLAERNSLRRLVFYTVLGGIAGGLFAGLTISSWIGPGVILGGVFGLGLAIAIEEKTKRADQLRKSDRAAEMAREREREHEAMIRAAKENGDFDRWDKQS